MENKITNEYALDELRRFSKMTPAELWDEYPERKQFEEKIVVDYANVKNNPSTVYNQFINYLQIPKRKPWVLDKICKRLRTSLDHNDPAGPNIHNNENTLENH